MTYGADDDGPVRVCFACAAESQTVTGLSAAAFTEMAQWRGVTPAMCDAAANSQRQLLMAASASGPASPLREGISPSLQLDIPLLDVDDGLYDDDDTPCTVVGMQGNFPFPKGGARKGRLTTPRTGGNRKRGQDSGTHIVVPTPKKASPGGEDLPARASTSLSGLTRRISFTTPPFGGRPGSSLGNMSVDGATGSSTARADTTPFMKSKRSASPFSTIKPVPQAFNTLQKINLMVNHTQPTAHRGRPRSGPATTAGRPSSAAGMRSTAPSPSSSIARISSQPASVTPLMGPATVVKTPPANAILHRPRSTPSPLPMAPPAPQAPSTPSLNQLFGPKSPATTDMPAGGIVAQVAGRPASRGAVQCSFGGFGGALSPVTVPATMSSQGQVTAEPVPSRPASAAKRSMGGINFHVKKAKVM